MIPKIIHYCWISGEENMPDDIKTCIESWHKYLPDYEFINWNDKNFDWNICEFTKHCRENNLYAFCSDYVRFWALYNYGGIYLDCDVMVYKSFDELLNLKRILTKEIYYKENNFPEAAIMGCEKGDVLFGKVIEWYNKTKKRFDLNKFVVSPCVMRSVIDKNYKEKVVYSLEDVKDDENKIYFLDVNKYFDNDSEDVFAKHNFKNSWHTNLIKNFLKHSNFKIFLCAHKPIENFLPRNKRYVILDVTGNVDNSCNDNFHEIIDISKDEFVKTHNVCYSEGAAMRYLYKHPDLIPDYIGFGHYRRIFVRFIGMESSMPKFIDRKNAIINTPYDFTTDFRVNNKAVARYDHPREDVNALIECVKEVAPEYWDSFNEFLKDKNGYYCNCFAMKKDDFLEMCEFCFRVLDRFDEKQGYKNNEDVRKHMEKLSQEKKLNIDKVDWQSRLQGFLLEYLTDTFYRHKSWIDGCCKSQAKMPIMSVNTNIL